MTSYYNTVLQLIIKIENDRNSAVQLNRRVKLRTKPIKGITLKLDGTTFTITDVVYDIDAECHIATLSPLVFVQYGKYKNNISETTDKYVRNGWCRDLPAKEYKMPKMTLDELIMGIHEVRNSTAPELFERTVCDLIKKSGVSNDILSQAFYFGKVSYDEGESIKRKLDLYDQEDILPVKEVDKLINELKKELKFTPHDHETIRFIFENEFVNSTTLSGIIDDHNDINEKSFKLGFIACIATCVYN